MTYPCILIVDDDPALLQALPEAIQLRMGECRVDTSDSAPAALGRIGVTDYDAIVSDIKMPGMDGLALLDHIHALRPDTPTLLITGHSEHDLAVQALRGGAYDLIQKPIDRDYFAASLARAIQVRALKRQVEQQQQAIERHAVELEQIVEQRTQELQLQATELGAIIEAMAESVRVCDATAYIVRVNQRAGTLLGITRDDLPLSIEQSMQWQKVYYPDGVPIPYKDLPLLRALRGETATDYHMLLRQSDRPEIHLRCSYAPIRDACGVITGGVAIDHDLTELIHLERHKDEFLSIASHELKTPLTSIKGLAQIVQRRLERAGSPEAAHLVKMGRAIGRMEMLVNDLLDISRIESGRLALRTEHADLVALCHQVADEQRAATGRRISVEIPQAPVTLEMDVDRISQVLANLLSNALKYSPADRPVVLSARTTDSEATLRVVDQGPGIPADELPHVFERFYRVPGITIQTGSGVGMGLGLYICHEIVERHGGRIWAESAPGKGSIFNVVLPVTPARKRADHTLVNNENAVRSHATRRTTP